MRYAAVRGRLRRRHQVRRLDRTHGLDRRRGQPDVLGREVRDQRHRRDAERLAEEVDEAVARRLRFAGEEDAPGVEVPRAVEEARRGQRAQEQARLDLFLDLAPAGGAETRDAALRLLLLFDATSLEPEQLPGDR